MSESELITAINEWTDSLNNRDFDTFYEIEKEAIGYGWRGPKFRDKPTDRDKKKQGILNWLKSMKKYEARFNPEKIVVYGNIALICGIYNETIINENTTTQNKVRTSMTWMKKQDKWKLILYHRDNQFT